MIAFVCTGNLNRSAAAEAIARQYGRHDVRSAGTSERATEHAPMAARMRRALVEHGIDAEWTTAHRASHISSLPREVVALGFQKSHLAACRAAGFVVVEAVWEHWPLPWAWTKIPDPAFDVALCGPVVEYLLQAVPAILEAYPCDS